MGLIVNPPPVPSPRKALVNFFKFGYLHLAPILMVALSFFRVENCRDLRDNFLISNYFPFS